MATTPVRRIRPPPRSLWHHYRTVDAGPLWTQKASCGVAAGGWGIGDAFAKAKGRTIRWNGPGPGSRDDPQVCWRSMEPCDTLKWIEARLAAVAAGFARLWQSAGRFFHLRAKTAPRANIAWRAAAVPGRFGLFGGVRHDTGTSLGGVDGGRGGRVYGLPACAVKNSDLWPARHSQTRTGPALGDNQGRRCRPGRFAVAPVSCGRVAWRLACAGSVAASHVRAPPG